MCVVAVAADVTATPLVGMAARHQPDTRTHSSNQIIIIHTHHDQQTTMHFTTLAISTIATTALAAHPHRYRQVQAELDYFSCDGSLATPVCCDETESTSGVCDKANIVATVENIDVASCELYQGKSTYAWCCGTYLSSPFPFSSTGEQCEAGQVYTSVIEVVNKELGDVTA
ncbi:hypothetical protein M409DRAFT_53551 [Zasmidium cellare ATCC 36951]|uniref:Hydrophobin n=1 Tax=Zasmidium cellare ATCC 36951 TaxID=1080233 RepID=A0A6A6CM87_ZASCE|nr:uncharacterized protein M409DRAFT_53551 [Zasmidium cellare ATCC 36951]KAF2168265.1 hypothetical protein M409DRAFT_53551 [Zasmidium cellare ATCC 36951]